MTSFSIAAVAAAAPLLMALVPCVFANVVKAPGTSVPHLVDEAAQEASAEDRIPWWKPSALGIDNYS